MSPNVKPKDKFNVWEWQSNNWKYRATVEAETEVIAITKYECRYGAGKYKAYQHIDNA